MDEYLALTTWMEACFRAEGAVLSGVYFDPTHPVHGHGDYRRVSEDRKPALGMLLKARDEIGIDLTRSALVGDKESDLEAGRAAGLGHTVRVVGPATRPVTQANFVAADLAGAIDWLISRDAE